MSYVLRIIEHLCCLCDIISSEISKLSPHLLFVLIFTLFVYISAFSEVNESDVELFVWNELEPIQTLCVNVNMCQYTSAKIYRSFLRSRVWILCSGVPRFLVTLCNFFFFSVFIYLFIYYHFFFSLSYFIVHATKDKNGNYYVWYNEK